MYKDIVFDLGGVIVDVHVERAVNSFRALGVHDAAKLIDASHHKDIFIDFETGKIDTEEFCEMLSKHVGKPLARADIESAWMSIIDPPPQYKLNYISELRRQHRIFILTNNNPIIIGRVRSNGYCPDGKPLTAYIDKMYVSYEMKCCKPDAEIFRIMTADAGFNPAETLYIDDSPANTAAAAALGFQTLTVANGTDWREKLPL
ncbi:MAG: HAD family phosphatase [Tannerella sp.]|jgi:putative hydrolase of the HAD superfamily|nr:HAD family phosphatase [Tannerella sp.]